MTILLSTPLSKQEVRGLRAGDEVALSGSILALNLQTATPDGSFAGRLPAAQTAGEGWICCLAVAPVDVVDPVWSVARFDAPEADRVACALLAAGGRGLICRGRCPATTSYALRKYGGVCFGAPERWLEGREAGDAPIGAGVDDQVAVLLIAVKEARLVVTHDAHGRQVATDA